MQPERAAEAREKLWKASQIFAARKNLTRSGAQVITISDLTLSDESRKAAGCIFVKALFERSASSALTWLFWFFLCQDKKNTEGRNEKLNELSIDGLKAMKKRYLF